MAGEELVILQTIISKMDIIVNVIKEYMRDVYLNVPIFPREEGYRGSTASGVSSVSVVGDVIKSDVGGEGKFEGFDMDKDLLQLRGIELNHR